MLGKGGDAASLFFSLPLAIHHLYLSLSHTRKNTILVSHSMYPTQHQDQVKKGGDGKAATESCGACGEVFPSRSRLFAHIREFPDHAVLKVVSGGRGKGKGGR